MKKHLGPSCMVVLSLVLVMTPLLSSMAWQAEPIPGLGDLARFMKRYQKYTSDFSRYRYSTSHSALSDPDLNFWAAQLAATDASFMGRPNDALRYFPMASHPPESVPDPSDYYTADAVQWIIAQAAHHRVVMINEAHHIPQTRLLTLSLLKPLHDAGFHYLALETLENNGTPALPDGVVMEKSGGYTREPVMADLVREALRIGYTLVPYEAPHSVVRNVDAREETQARNLEAFLEKHPGEKLLIHAGYAHIAKTPAVKIGDARVMATRLISATRAKVLSIDQTELMPMSLSSQAAIAVQAELAKAFKVTGPVVFLSNKDKTAWSAVPGAYDAGILLPPSPRHVVRPDWLSLGGVRRKVFVDTNGCAQQFPCLVQATRLGEPRDAVPADQFVFQVDADEHTPLFLRDGSYRLRYTTYQDQIVVDRRMDVPGHMGEIAPDRSR